MDEFLGRRLEHFKQDFWSHASQLHFRMTRLFLLSLGWTDETILATSMGGSSSVPGFQSLPTGSSHFAFLTGFKMVS